jgi:hypothetical protein
MDIILSCHDADISITVTADVDGFTMGAGDGDKCSGPRLKSESVKSYGTAKEGNVQAFNMNHPKLYADISTAVKPGSIETNESGPSTQSAKLQDHGGKPKVAVPLHGSGVPQSSTVVAKSSAANPPPVNPPPANPSTAGWTGHLPPSPTQLDPAEVARRKALILANCNSGKPFKGLPQLGFNDAAGLPKLCKTVVGVTNPNDILGLRNELHNAIENEERNNYAAIRYVFDRRRPDKIPVLYFWLDHKYGATVDDKQAQDDFWDVNNFLNWYASLPLAERRDLKAMYDEYCTFAKDDPRRDLPGNYRNHPEYKAIQQAFKAEWLAKDAARKLARLAQGHGGYQGRGGGRSGTARGGGVTRGGRGR